MKAFLFAYDTNYDLGAALIYAKTKKEAIEKANNCDYVWDTNNILEIDMNTTSKIIIITSSEFKTI